VFINFSSFLFLILPQAGDNSHKKVSNTFK